MEFEYKLVSKNGLTIVTFKGRMGKDARDQLKKCHDEVMKTESGIVIFLFKDVPTVDMAIYREITLLQQENRKNRQVFVVGLNRSLKQVLLDKAIIRFSELRESLEETLKGIGGP